jgi:hypothetical protein
MSKLLKPAFAAQIQCSKVGALQPRAQGIPQMDKSKKFVHKGHLNIQNDQSAWALKYWVDLKQILCDFNQ